MSDEEQHDNGGKGVLRQGLVVKKSGTTGDSSTPPSSKSSGSGGGSRNQSNPGTPRSPIPLSQTSKLRGSQHALNYEGSEEVGQKFGPSLNNGYVMVRAAQAGTLNSGAGDEHQVLLTEPSGYISRTNGASPYADAALAEFSESCIRMKRDTTSLTGWPDDLFGQALYVADMFFFALALISMISLAIILYWHLATSWLELPPDKQDFMRELGSWIQVSVMSINMALIFFYINSFRQMLFRMFIRKAHLKLYRYTVTSWLGISFCRLTCFNEEKDPLFRYRNAPLRWRLAIMGLSVVFFVMLATVCAFLMYAAAEGQNYAWVSWVVFIFLFFNSFWMFATVPIVERVWFAFFTTVLRWILCLFPDSKSWERKHNLAFIERKIRRLRRIRVNNVDSASKRMVKNFLADLKTDKILMDTWLERINAVGSAEELDKQFIEQIEKALYPVDLPLKPRTTGESYKRLLSVSLISMTWAIASHLGFNLRGLSVAEKEDRPLLPYIAWILYDLYSAILGITRLEWVLSIVIAIGSDNIGDLGKTYDDLAAPIWYLSDIAKVIFQGTWLLLSLFAFCSFPGPEFLIIDQGVQRFLLDHGGWFSWELFKWLGSRPGTINFNLQAVRIVADEFTVALFYYYYLYKCYRNPSNNEFKKQFGRYQWMYWLRAIKEIEQDKPPIPMLIELMERENLDPGSVDRMMGYQNAYSDPVEGNGVQDLFIDLANQTLQDLADDHELETEQFHLLSAPCAREAMQDLAAVTAPYGLNKVILIEKGLRLIQNQ